jgi:hypothetical protein
VTAYDEVYDDTHSLAKGETASYNAKGLSKSDISEPSNSMICDEERCVGFLGGY